MSSQNINGKKVRTKKLENTPSEAGSLQASHEAYGPISLHQSIDLG